MGEELPRKGNSRYKGPEAGRCLEWEDQGRKRTTMAEAKKQGQGGKEMQVGRRRDQRLNVILKCPRNTEGSMQEGGGHWCESLTLPDHCLVALWIPKGLSPKARLSNQEFPDSWGQVEKMSWRGEWLPLQYSCPENPVDRGAWQTTVHSVAVRPD